MNVSFLIFICQSRININPKTQQLYEKSYLLSFIHFLYLLVLFFPACSDEGSKTEFPLSAVIFTV